jgi:ADP-heptose:LPS heptosyltransferase
LDEYARRVMLTVLSKPWKRSSPPEKILVMRFQALGDTVITLPYLADLRRQYPTIRIDFLTRKEVAQIPANIELFDRVIRIGGKRNLKIQLLLLILRLPWMWLQQYDAVIDLQNHKLSRFVRIALRCEAWSAFECYEPVPAGERTRKAIEALWKWKIGIHPFFKLSGSPPDALLTRNGWKAGHELVVLNPAGYCESRNWPLEHYIAFAESWRKHRPQTQFVLLLLPSLKLKANYIKARLGEHCIDLTGRTDQYQAFSIIQQSSLMVSEDSGLMHMAWVQGIPTIALFSSSRKDWSQPLGTWSACLDSADLECGPCGLEVCKFDDNRCLVRYSGEMICNTAFPLVRDRQPRVS